MAKNLSLARMCERIFGGNPPRRGRGVPKIQQTNSGVRNYNISVSLRPKVLLLF